MKRQRHFEIFKGKVRWYWRLRAANGEIEAQSEGYFSKSNARRSAKELAKAMKISVVDEKEFIQPDWLDSWVDKPKKKAKK